MSSCSRSSKTARENFDLGDAKLKEDFSRLGAEYVG
jgi:hypothetical protein